MADRLPNRTDVLIVGAGPAGLTLGVTLALLGISHVIIDPKPGVAPGSKAAAIQPRSLEYLDRIGLADRLVDDGLRGNGFAAVDGDRPLLGLSYESVPGPYPFLLLVSQQQIETRIEQRLEELGTHVARGVRLLDLIDGFPGSAATLVTDDGTPHVLDARYVVGCDGLHSTVRRLRGIDFPGDAPPALFALADVILDGDDEVGRDTTFSFSIHGMLLTSALPGGRLRVVASVPPGTSAPDEAAVSQLLAQRGARWAREATLKSIAASSTYQVQQRVASSMQSGNAFLVGDAAHTHSPAGGQGMNTGFQDAANLGWKLHHVLTGRCGAELLDTYDAERRPVANGLIDFTAQLMKLAMIVDPAAAALRNDALEAVGQLPAVRDWLATKLSQLDIGYPSADPSDPWAGRRVDPRTYPPSGLSWTLLTPPGVSAVGTPAPGVTVATSDAVPGVIAVRPDGIAADAAMARRAIGVDVGRHSVDTVRRG